LVLHTHAEFVVLILQGQPPECSYAAITLKGLGSPGFTVRVINPVPA